MYFQIALCGNFIDLEPLCEAHREDLRPLAEEETNWRYFPYNASGSAFDEWIDQTIQNMKRGLHLAYVVRDRNNKQVLGTTRYYEIKPDHQKLTIGHTWYIPEIRGSVVNPESKFLLLQNAFEALEINRVEFNADSRNAHSIGAIKKLGAKQEGILRQHTMTHTGYIRDTVIFSILKSEWPHVKEKLQQRINSSKS